MHLLVEMAQAVTVPRLVKQVKGVSSYAANRCMAEGVTFKWQGSYAAFTVSRWDVARIIGYIQQQRVHHGEGTIIAQLEQAEKDEDER